MRNDSSALGVLMPCRLIALRSENGEEVRESGEKRLNMGSFFFLRLFGISTERMNEAVACVSLA